MKAKLLDKEGCVHRGGGKAQELEGTARAATHAHYFDSKTSGATISISKLFELLIALLLFLALSLSIAEDF